MNYRCAICKSTRWIKEMGAIKVHWDRSLFKLIGMEITKERDDYIKGRNEVKEKLAYKKDLKHSDLKRFESFGGVSTD